MAAAEPVIDAMSAAVRQEVDASPSPHSDSLANEDGQPLGFGELFTRGRGAQSPAPAEDALHVEVHQLPERLMHEMLGVGAAFPQNGSGHAFPDQDPMQTLEEHAAANGDSPPFAPATSTQGDPEPGRPAHEE